MHNLANNSYGKSPGYLKTFKTLAKYSSERYYKKFYYTRSTLDAYGRQLKCIENFWRTYCNIYTSVSYIPIWFESETGMFKNVFVNIEF